MASRYIYAGTRSTALKKGLLSNDQLEMILAGEDLNASFQALHETFLAPYIARRQPSELSDALEKAVADTKKLLTDIAPQPELLDILWLKYDFYNLQAIIKGEIKRLSEEEILAKCFESAKYPPRKLLEHFQNNRLAHLHPHLEQARQEAAKYKEISDIAVATNRYYLLTAKEIADKFKDRFAQKYTALLIDIYNLQANLRAHSSGEIDEAPLPVFIPGGTWRLSDLETPEKILEKLPRMGPNAEFWKEAIENYRQDGTFIHLEKACDEYLNRFLREESRNIFSPAPLFAYFQARKNNVQLIRTVLVGKQTGLSEYEIRKTLRELFD